MDSYEFKLVLADVYTINQTLEYTLCAAGCDDAVLVCRNGIVYLKFDRKAESLEDAVLSAICDVDSAHFRVKRVEPEDYVYAAEIARRTNLSREYIRQLIKGETGPGRFPTAITTFGNTNLWRWADVSDWLARHGFVEISLAQNAQLLSIINDLLKLRQHLQKNKTLLFRLRKRLGLEGNVLEVSEGK